jgi:hypothetical protein
LIKTNDRSFIDIDGKELQIVTEGYYPTTNHNDTDSIEYLNLLLV